MKVFVSSLILGFEEVRNAASAAISTLGHEPVRAEDFPASPDSPQAACLNGVRQSGAVVLILGARYGYPQQSGLSATHEEYREARETRPVLVFVQDGVERDAKQAEFLLEVQGWEKGHYTASFSSASELRDEVTRALHDFTLSAAAAPLDEAELVSRARDLIPMRQRFSSATLFVSIAPGPVRATLRPAEVEAASLATFLLSESLTGPCAVLTTEDGTERAVHGDAIRLEQRRAGRLVHLDESGRVAIAHPVVSGRGQFPGISSIIEEDVQESIARCLRFAARVFDHIDPANRLSHVAPLVAVLGAGYLPWRTRAEQEQSPNQATIAMRGEGDVVVTLTPPARRRPALVHDTNQLAEDFAVRLRRGVRG